MLQGKRSLLWRACRPDDVRLREKQAAAGSFLRPAYARFPAPGVKSRGRSGPDGRLDGGHPARKSGARFR